MRKTLKIDIDKLPEDTAKAILMAASQWNCSPGEAVRILLNEVAASDIKPCA